MSKQASKHKVTIIAGPTASGKSAFALEVAKDQDIVIINADSMQVYDAVQILTAQPSMQEQAEAPHRLYSILPPEQICTVTKWRELALKEIYKTIETGAHPVLVGGTGFYMKGLCEGLSSMPDIDEEVHLAVLKQGEDDLATLYAELQEKDPILVEKLAPNDKQRICRAVEVFRATGKPLSWWQEQPLTGAPEDLDFSFIIIRPDRAWLHQRINQRVHDMLEMGAMEEIKHLVSLSDQGKISEHQGVVKAHGFRPFRDYLKGRKTLDEAIEQTQTETRQYAKRQDTWFRHQIKKGGHIKQVDCKTVPIV